MTLRVKLRIAGVNRMMTQSRPVVEKVTEVTERIAGAAGPGFQAVINHDHGWVVRGYVESTTSDAARSEHESLVLTNAIDAGRD